MGNVGGRGPKRIDDQELTTFTEQLLVQALHAGVSLSVFWDLTPRETVQTIEAVNWRLEQDQRARAWLAWHVAALSRAKRMPLLSRMVNPPAARRLPPDEAEVRRKEFADMRAKWQNRGTHHE